MKTSHSPNRNRGKVCNKIAEVSDEVCADCPQNWDGECRAFCLPHSLEEQRQRTNHGQNMGKMKCFPLANNAAPYTAPESADAPLGAEPHTYLNNRPLQEVVDDGSESPKT